MKRPFLILSFAVFLLAAPAAHACTPPEFAIPAQVNVVYEKQKNREDVAAPEKFLLESYERDKGRYLDIYGQLHPCGLYDEGEVTSDVTQTQADVMKQELLLIERKWGLDGATAANEANEEEFIEVPEGQIVNIE